MKRYFHEELETIRSNLMLMGEKSIESVNVVMRALIESDMNLAQKVIEGDDAIDDIETRIDDEVARYVNLRAPVARDLRLLFVTIKSSHDLERVGDEAASIGGRVNDILKTGQPISDLASIPRMAEHSVGMLQSALSCFIEENIDEAYAICMRDKEVDHINRENFQHYVDRMKGNPSNALMYTELVFISKCFERIADHATNIAEEVYYLLTSESLKKKISEEKGR